MHPNVTLIVQQPLQAIQHWLHKRTAQTHRSVQQLTGYGLAVRTGITAGNAAQEYHYTVTIEKDQH